MESPQWSNLAVQNSGRLEFYQLSKSSYQRSYTTRRCQTRMFCELHSPSQKILSRPSSPHSSNCSYVQSTLKNIWNFQIQLNSTNIGMMRLSTLHNFKLGLSRCHRRCDSFRSQLARCQSSSTPAGIRFDRQLSLCSLLFSTQIYSVDHFFDNPLHECRCQKSSSVFGVSIVQTSLFGLDNSFILYKRII